jgi:uncharacterized protein (TIGR00369 family)
VDGEISDSWVVAKDGEFAGWMNWPSDNWEVNGGPFYFRREEDGTVRCAFRATSRHMNGQDHMHGGCMMTFADFAMFGIAAVALGNSRAVTVSMNSEFVAAAQAGDLVEATGEVIKAGKRVIFLRGKLFVGEKVILTFSGTLMRLS